MLPNLLLDTTSFPVHLLVLFCFRRHLSLVFGAKTPDPLPGSNLLESWPEASRGSQPARLLVDSFQQPAAHPYLLRRREGNPAVIPGKRNML